MLKQDKDKNKLTPRQEDFIQRYVDESAPTYKNATQAYKASHPGCAYSTAMTQGSKALSNPKIGAALVQIYAEQGLDSEVSAHTLADIARGTALATTTTYDKDGKVLAQVQSSPKPSDRIKAIHEYHKVTGQHDAARAAVDIAKDRELLKLIERQGLPGARRGRGG